MPAQSLMLRHIDSTYVNLSLDTWQTNGCPINSFDIQYQVMGDYVWHKVQTNISPNFVSIEENNLKLHNPSN